MATLAEMVGVVTVMLGAKLDSVVASAMASTTSSDPKNPSDMIRVIVLDALASVASTVARSPLQTDAWLFTTRVDDLGVGDVRYLIDKTEITGPIVLVDVSYTEEEPYEYKHAEPDSATAIQDFRTLYTAGRRLNHLLSYSIAGDAIYFPGTAISVVFIPGDIGDSGSDVTDIPRKYADWAQAIALAFLFGRDGGKIGAAQHYAQLAARAESLVLKGVGELPAFQPYAGG